MNSLDWLEANSDAIIRRWKARAQAFAGEGAGGPWEQRIGDTFDQVCVLVAGDCVGAGDADVESKLFQCRAIKEDAGHHFSARLLACGRQAIGDVSEAGGSVEARRCAAACGNAIDHLQHMLRANACHDCRETNCCMRVEFLRPIPGGVNE